MAHAPLVEANGAKIPAIGLGTWPIKGEACVRAVAAALKAGYRHIDTAWMYGNEIEVGEGLKAGGVPRDHVWVTTKVWHDNIGQGKLEASAEESLKKLGLASVDLLLIHWPSPMTPIKEAIAGLVNAKKRGLAKHIGISNFTVRMIDEAVAASREPLVVNQVEYHPHLDQSKVLAACRRHGLALTAYCPLGRGAVGGVLDERVVKDIAKAKAKTPAQVVLRWHMQQKGVVAVPKSETANRIAENIAVFDFNLSDDDMSRLSKLTRADGRVVKPDFAPQWDT
jgi:diketogulonate reductase-like aldo/keto reductase